MIFILMSIIWLVPFEKSHHLNNVQFQEWNDQERINQNEHIALAKSGKFSNIT